MKHEQREPVLRDRITNSGWNSAPRDLSVIIVSWNTRDLLDRCLSTLENALATCPFNSEVWVVDNASSDGSAAMIRTRHPTVQLIANLTNVGFARANNQAIERATGHFVLLLNSDTEVVDNSLQTLMALLDRQPLGGIAGPKLINPDGSYQAGPARFPTLATTVLETWGLIQHLSGNSYYPSDAPSANRDPMLCDWLGGACLLVRREAIAEVGLLDDAFFMNSEEVDWCFRMRQKSWQIWYAPEATIVHLGGASASRSSVSQRKRNYRGKVLFLTKHRGIMVGRAAEMNFRLASACKACAYLLRSVIQQRGDRSAAMNHWRVAKEAW